MTAESLTPAVVILDLDHYTAGHLRLALEHYTAWARTNAIPLPDGLKALTAHASRWATKGQHGPEGDAMPVMPHAHRVVSADLLDLPTVAARLGRSVSTTKRMVKAGTIPVVETPGVRGRRVRRADLERLIAG